MDADPKPEPLILSEGIRFAHLDEVPSRQREQIAERIAAARLTTGFRQWRRQGSSFSDFFEANVHAPRLWNVFSDLALAILPEVASPIVGIRDEEPLYGPYTDRDAALAVFEPHVRHLVHDGFLEFGIIFQHKGATEEVFTEEVFVPYAKYLRIWTNKPEAVRAVFKSHGIPEAPELQFIDEFPRTSKSLSDENWNAGWPPVMERLKEAFESLPRR